jgi:hypothetical protein
MVTKKGTLPKNIDAINFMVERIRSPGKERKPGQGVGRNPVPMGELVWFILQP